MNAKLNISRVQAMATFLVSTIVLLICFIAALLLTRTALADANDDDNAQVAAEIAAELDQMDATTKRLEALLSAAVAQQAGSAPRRSR